MLYEEWSTLQVGDWFIGSVLEYEFHKNEQCLCHVQSKHQVHQLHYYMTNRFTPPQIDYLPAVHSHLYEKIKPPSKLCRLLYNIDSVLKEEYTRLSSTAIQEE